MSPIDEKVKMVKQKLLSTYAYWSIKKMLKAELIKSKYAKEQCKELIPKAMEQNGFKVHLQNEITKIYEEMLTTSTKLAAVTNETGVVVVLGDKPVKKKIVDTEGNEKFIELPSIPLQNEDKLDVVEYARVAWIDFIKEQLLSISSQLNIPLASKVNYEQENEKKKKKKKKPNQRVESSLETSESLSQKQEKDELPKYTGVFGPSNLFEVCIKIQNPNHERSFSPNIVGWGLIKLEIKPLTIKQLRQTFEELDPEVRQVGVDDERKEWFYKEALNVAKRISQAGYLPDIIKFARTGIPISLRPKIWKQILGVNSSQKEKIYFEQLCIEVSKVQYLIDDMIANDVKRTCDDDNYFVFEETLYTVMKIFSRDPWIKENCSLAPLCLYGIDQNGKKRTAYPPSSVIPFEGLSLMCAPLCFVFANIEEIYFVFRNFYAKILCRLHTVSSEKDSLLSLCKYFEDILQEKDPQLFYHLLQMNIHPLSIAFHWIFHAFAGYLNPEQLLLLWDRIIGYDNMYLLSILAASIFIFRSSFLMKTTSQQEIYDVFSDFTIIRSIPLLQLFLFNK